MRTAAFVLFRLAAGLVLFFATATTCWAATTLQVLTMGSPGKEFEQWGNALSVNASHPLTFRWSTTMAGATGGDWEVTTTNPANAVVSVKKGSLPSTAGIGKLALFDIAFLPLLVPTTAHAYVVRITAHDAQLHPLGSASLPVTITYEPAGPPPTFAPNMGGTPPPYIETGHPKVRLIRYDPLDEATTGKLQLDVFNDEAAPTSPVEIRIADAHQIVRQTGAPVPVGSLKQNEHATVTFTLDKQLTVGEPSVQANYDKWRQRYGTGLRIRVGSNKTGNPHVQWQPRVIAGRASSIACGVVPESPAALFTKARTCVEDRMRAILAVSDGTQGFLFKRVGGPVLASQNSAMVFEPASTIKIIINFAAFKAMQKNPALTLTSQVPWFQDFEKKSNGKDSSCPADTNPASDALKASLAAMMMQSDNRRTQALRMFLGQDAINATAHSIGMANTLYQHRDGCGKDAVAHPNQLTLDEAGKLYAGVADGSLLSGQPRIDFYTVMNQGVRAALSTIVQQEAPDGMPPDRVQSFINAMNDHWKYGSYGLSTGEFRTGAGSISIPFRSGGGVTTRDFVYGGFVVRATNGDKADAIFTVANELAREQIREALWIW